ncbi:MAG: hypothetical protein BWZ10_02502 [candidate division BRC1 bacterium ADurb.BinA364]|nr:MAG: hypothetical protein BWZ10_02502 [candidate division BRC1 bacterium ADurb.BinA364]
MVARLAEGDRSQRALAHAARGFDVEGIGARLKIDQERQPFSPCALRGLAHGENARRIDRDRLGQIDMLAGIDRGASLFGMEIRRRFDRHGVQIAELEQGFVAGERGEAAVLRHAEFLAKRLGLRGKVIGGGGDFIASVSEKQLADPGSASAAADHSQANLLARCGAQRQAGAGQSQSGGGAAFEDGAARDAAVVHARAFH